MKFTYLKDRNFSNGRNYIGASDIGTLCLCNLKYGQTPLKLWEVLTGREKSWSGNESTEWGHHLEGLILKKALMKLMEYDKSLIDKWYINKISDRNRYSSVGFNAYSNTEAVCPYFNHITAHADLIVVDNNSFLADGTTPDETNNSFIIEAKSSRFFSAKRNDDENFGYSDKDLSENGIPLGVYLQVQTQMLCYDMPYAYVALLADTSSHRLYGRINKNVKTQEHILAIAERFWQCVETDTPPKPETWEDVVALNPNLDKESKTVISGDSEQKVLIMKDQYKRISKAIKKLDARQDDIKNAIGLLIGENAYLQNAEGESLAKAFEVTRETISLSNIKKELPEVAQILIDKNMINKSTSRQIRF